MTPPLQHLGLPQLAPGQRRAVGAALGVLGVVAWWQLVAGPQWRAIAAVRPKVIALRRQIRDVRQGLAQLPQMKARQDALRTKLKAQPRSLVPERLPGLMDGLAQLAKAQGMMVERIRPAQVRGQTGARERKTHPPDGYPADGEALMDFSVVPIEILGQAGYHEIGRFLEAVEHAEQPYRVRSLRIEGDRRNPLRHRMEVTVEALVAVDSP